MDEKLQKIAIGQSAMEKYATKQPFRWEKARVSFRKATLDACNTCYNRLTSDRCKIVIGSGMNRTKVCDLHTE